MEPNGRCHLNRYRLAHPEIAMTDSIDTTRRRLLGAGALTLAGAGFGFYNPRGQAMFSSVEPVLARGPLDALRGASAWINSPPLTEAQLQGRVVLIDVCTYTCINWLRTLPYVRAWADKYKSHGLVVIGVHSPEFQFEHDQNNVRRALKDMRIEHPIAMDNEFSIWRAFQNVYWPSRYLIDARGRIRHRRFGEGEYDGSEQAIQKVLAEAGAASVTRDLVAGTGHGIEAAPDWDNLQTPETYVGYERTRNFSSLGGLAADKRRMYTLPQRLRLNDWALAGDWTMKQQATLLHTANGRIAMSFHARDVHLVMGPATRGVSVPFRVTLDGRPPGVARGGDVDEQGNGVVVEQRLYQLIRQPAQIDKRTFAIEFLAPGVEAFALTFG
jgi:hypothetical protein